ncbi:MAG: hypothetical protein M9892_05545 [Bacteroidetes bacterium]|nr:hypothetical protein [Bacteroidota bacterium]
MASVFTKYEFHAVNILTINVLDKLFGCNGLALGAVADFGAQNCHYTTKDDACIVLKKVDTFLVLNPVTSLHIFQ